MGAIAVGRVQVDRQGLAPARRHRPPALDGPVGAVLVQELGRYRPALPDVGG